MDKGELKKLQSERLVKTIRRVWENVPYYAKKMKDANLTPDDIKGVEDLYKLPFTVKQDLRDNYPFGTFAAPLSDVVRVHASSGTTGKQTVVGYTKNDIDLWSECVARSLGNVGVTKDDIVHVAYGYGLFTGGLGLHYGAELLGATVVPASGGNSKRQIQLIVDFGATVLCCTPSYALYLADELKELGYTKDDLKLRVGIFGAEPWSEEMRREIEQRLGVLATDNFGLSEVMGPGVGGECEYKCGMHIAEDHFLAEIIDPQTGEVLPPGSVGELVLTTLTKQAFPMIRYRTRDITRLHYETCKCGRTMVRMEKTRGRSDDMLIVKGVNVFPTQIEEVLFQVEGCAPHYQLVLDREGHMDTLEVQVEVNEKIFFDEMRKQREFVAMVEKRLAATLGLRARVKLVEPSSIPRHEGKANRVIDRRKA
jgi:phenylacetate-CoA ligase